MSTIGLILGAIVSLWITALTRYWPTTLAGLVTLGTFVWITFVATLLGVP